MTTEHAMLSSHFRCSVLATLLASLALVVGCSSKPRYPNDPVMLSAPYGNEREIVWAGAPFRTESGVSFVDELRLSDAMVSQIVQARGVTALPLNRSLEAMRSMNLPAITTQAQALQLARQLNADAVLVGTITAWDPYDPPTLGLNLVLFARSETMQLLNQEEFNPRQLQTAPSDTAFRAEANTPGQSINQITAMYDAANGLVRQNLQDYAHARHDPESAMGWQQYTQSMARFEEFACFQALSELLGRERQRLLERHQKQNNRPTR
ncbi:MAG: hypothetical protein ACF8MJ_08675 [Phycisphaerales bacterium JB050]